MKDVERMFAYHGAEHKTIFCYEKGLPLTVENVRPQSRFHPRCGTSFLFVVVIISILVFSLVSLRVGLWDNPWVRIGLRLLLLPSCPSAMRSTAGSAGTTISARAFCPHRASGCSV